ncbi:unnamed protein product [Adineta steineri]|uniref:G-protein coupled receptors family 1 profile domain-containing protein n=1 Tax=Adineta steineri TaxID=433720 RepID=A0A813RDU5_9BILA|nr:unnamed protein product [Adineta steineri]CAF1071440.1 unnamed protein product [Adineta steineri]
MHTLIMVNIQELSPSVVVCYYDLSKSYQNFVFYYLAIINILFSSIMIILCSLSFKNVRHIRIVPRQQRNQVRSMTKKDFQLLRCLFALVIVTIIFRIGINIFYAYSAITREQIRTQLHQDIDTFLNNFLSLFFNLSYSVSFIVFVVISKAFRCELKQMVYKMFGRDQIPMREEENGTVNTIVVSNVIVPT